VSYDPRAELGAGQADEEMLASVQMDPAQAPQVEAEVHSLIEQSNILKKNAMEQRRMPISGGAAVASSPEQPAPSKHVLGWRLKHLPRAQANYLHKQYANWGTNELSLDRVTSSRDLVSYDPCAEPRAPQAAII